MILTSRRVPAPLPPAPAPTRLRTHPQVRLPRQPATRHPPAALLPTAPWLEKHARSCGITFHGPAALALELSGLRRNHARRRTALCRATPAPLSTSTRTARSLNLNPHPWLLILLGVLAPYPTGSEFCIARNHECVGHHNAGRACGVGSQVTVSKAGTGGSPSPHASFACFTWLAV